METKETAANHCEERGGWVAVGKISGLDHVSVNMSVRGVCVYTAARCRGKKEDARGCGEMVAVVGGGAEVV